MCMSNWTVHTLANIFDIFHSGTRLELYPHVKGILVDVHSHDHWQETKIAVASRTIAPEWAKECLEKFKVRKVTCAYAQRSAFRRSPKLGGGREAGEKVALARSARRGGGNLAKAKSDRKY